MESVFSRFESYDFAADQRFRDGLKTLRGSAEGDKLRDAKLFFYNRFVEPIDRMSYKEWLSDPSRVNHRDDGKQDHSFRAGSLPGVGDEPTAGFSAEAETLQLSFAEVMRLVQEGKEVPGVKRLEVKASNQSPTPSQMGRVVKPWETS